MLQFTAQREIDAAILDVSGRQRMLSQRISLILIQLASSNNVAHRSEYLAEIRQLIHTIHSSHLGLLHGNAELKLPGNNSDAINRLFWDEPVHLNRQLMHFVKQVQYLVQLPDLSFDHGDLRQLTTHTAKALLDALDLVVKQYAQESETRQVAMVTQLAELCDRQEQMIAQTQAQTQELHDTLNALHDTQIRLIHSEKMNGLSQLVAGIAHEINNPINFIHANLSHAIDYAQDLTQLLKIYQDSYPEATPPIQDYYDSIDGNFLMADFPRLIKSMESGTTRVRSIVLSLRSFARLDEADFKPVSLEEGLASSVLFMQHRLETYRAQQIDIQLHYDYQTLPDVTCYPALINQVFTALLNNAIDALAEKHHKTPPCLNPNILLRTRLLEAENSIVIEITDNGIGIPRSIYPRIFNPFFTTKPIGQGTGLGLAVCDQIIARHGGRITIESEPNQGTTVSVYLPIQAIAAKP